MKFFFIIIITLILKIQSSYIKLPFKKFTTYQKDKNYFDYLEKNDIVIIFEIGTPIQSIPIFINFDIYSFYISGPNLNGIYNENKSSTFNFIKKKRELSYFTSDVMSEGYESKDKFKLNDIKKKIINEELNFILPIKINKYKIKNFIPSSLGLRIHESYDTKNYSFLYILKQKEIIDSYGWTIKYINNDEGELIIGGYPHEYDTKYDFSKFKNTKVINSGNLVNWDLRFQYNLLNKENIRFCNAQFDITFGFIKVNFMYKNYIINDYFQFKNNCLKYNNSNYEYIICDSNENISDFPNLTLYNKDLNYTFEFNYKDLFIRNDNKLYFLIVFEKEYQIENWIIGKPFFKKYQLVFESDRKLIGIYIGKKNNQLNISWIIVYLLFIILFILIIYMIKKYKNMPKKIKANELLENIDSPFLKYY